MHWLLDVEFKDDLSRYRSGHGAKNMAVVRRFALNLVRANRAVELVDKLNRTLRGWANYFEVGTVTKAYRAIGGTRCSY